MRNLSVACNAVQKATQSSLFPGLAVTRRSASSYAILWASGSVVHEGFAHVVWEDMQTRNEGSGEDKERLAPVGWRQGECPVGDGVEHLHIFT